MWSSSGRESRFIGQPYAAAVCNSRHDRHAPRYRIDAPAPKKTKAQRFLAKPLSVLVGRVGIEPTTNGLRVQGTRETQLRKFKNRKTFRGRGPVLGCRPNLCRTRTAGTSELVAPFSNCANGLPGPPPNPYRNALAEAPARYPAVDLHRLGRCVTSEITPARSLSPA